MRTAAYTCIRYAYATTTLPPPAKPYRYQLKPNVRTLVLNQSQMSELNPSKRNKAETRTKLKTSAALPTRLLGAALLRHLASQKLLRCSK